MADKFEQYAIVELFGHQIIAGLVSEQVIGGQGFVRVDVPSVKDHPGFTKFYGAGAIYAMTPTDEATMMAAVEGLQAKPVETWKLNLPQLSARARSPEDDAYEDTTWRDEEEPSVED